MVDALGLGLASAGTSVGGGDGSTVDDTLGMELGAVLESNEGRWEEFELGCDVGLVES